MHHIETLYKRNSNKLNPFKKIEFTAFVRNEWKENKSDISWYYMKLKWGLYFLLAGNRWHDKKCIDIKQEIISCEIKRG